MVSLGKPLYKVDVGHIVPARLADASHKYQEVAEIEAFVEERAHQDDEVDHKSEKEHGLSTVDVGDPG